ncbi:MAG: putative 2OG-Fe(II) oxygenase [Opitutaceae bacterium]
MPAQAGTVVLFESWLRHEVSPHPVDAERISISFNYNWF